MIDTLEDAREALARIGLPQALLDLLAKEMPKRLRYQLRLPTRFFRVRRELIERVPASVGYVPILEINGEVLYAFDTGTAQFVEHWYEEEKATTIGPSYQQLIGWILVDFGYAGLEELIHEAAPLLGFQYAERLGAFLATDDGIRVPEDKQRFIAGLVP